MSLLLVQRAVRQQSHYRKTKAAIETYEKVIEAGGQATYLKKALKKRRDDIILIFTEALNISPREL